MIFTENLTKSFFVNFLLLWSRGDLRTKDLHLYYFDASTNGLHLARYFSRFFSARVEKLEFRYDDSVDDAGVNVALRILHEDLENVWARLSKGRCFFGKTKSVDIDDWFIGYVKKYLTTEVWPDLESKKTLESILFMLQVAKLKALNSNELYQSIFFMEIRPWMIELAAYADDHGLKLVAIHPLIIFKNRVVNFLKQAYPFRHSKMILERELDVNRESQKIDAMDFDHKEPKIVVDQVMQYFAAGSFWSSSELEPQTVVFVSKSHKIGSNELRDIRKVGMQFIALNSGVATGLDVPLYIQREKGQSIHSKLDFSTLKMLERGVLKKLEISFYQEKKYWCDFFKILGSRVYVNHNRWGGHPVAAAAAIHDLGGVSATWQVSYAELPVPYADIYADLVFGFSPTVAKCDLEKGSSIQYFISVGYIGDYRFKLLKFSAIEIRTKMKKCGAQKIISFFDENSSEDERWSIGNSTTQKEYQFLLEKVIVEDWIGLIIKPKKPETLRKRLGEVASLLERAIETGRCHLFEDNYVTPPANAALASDVAIHSVFGQAVTAGMEAAIAGTPTLLLDGYGWERSQLYQLGKGRVIFNDMESLWTSLHEHWSKRPIPRFGDWTPIIEDLDPFRDGKAAYRMTTYLHWLIQGFKQGLDREIIMADAAERYCKEWGEDKVMYMN